MQSARRTFLLGCACLCSLLPTLVARSQGRKPRTGVGGCFFSQQSDAARVQEIKGGVYRTSTGDAKLDATVSAVLFRAARAYSLSRNAYPAFRFIPPGAAGGDGFADDGVSMDPSTKGIVALGLGLLKEFQSDDFGIIAFEVIAGHEFGHIFQTRNQYVEPLLAGADGKAKLVELHADFLAGWFMSRRGQLPVEILRYVVDALFSRGDDLVGEPEHHGTKAERFAAVLQGYLRGTATDSPEGAAANGLAYLREVT